MVNKTSTLGKQTGMAVERKRLLQTDWRARVERYGREQWLTLSFFSQAPEEKVGIFSCLAPADALPRALSHFTWDLQPRSGGPAIYGTGLDDFEYERFGESNGIEPLVHHRQFHDIRPDYVELAEEFRHFHRLYHDAANNVYLSIDNDGDEEDAVRVDGDNVEVRLKYVKQFLPFKGVALVVFFEIFRYSTATLEELGLEPIDEEVTGADGCHAFLLKTCDYRAGYPTMSKFIGKRVVFGLPLEETGIPPFEAPRPYLDFIIGTDEHGRETTFSCDPEGLSNYFGANPGAPNYLTPVFFRREVLKKYYDHPDKYRVEDGHVVCAGLWSFRIDNNHDRYVTAYLGDLGRDLSHKEQQYWRAFNVVPDGTISEVAFKRGFDGEFTDPQRADLRFRQQMRVFRKKWEGKHGWPLFRELNEEDRHCLESLRIPLTNDIAEFDNQVLRLTKALVDSLNQVELLKALPAARQAELKGKATISVFEAYLQEAGVADATTHVKFLRALQTMRSTGAAHRRGKDFAKDNKALLPDGNRIAAFEGMLESALDLLTYLDTRLIGN